MTSSTASWSTRCGGTRAASPSTLAEFRKVVDTTDFEREAGYDADFPLDGDWHVEYCRSVMPDGREAFYLVWSAFEYIWVKARFFDIGEDE